MQRKTKPTNQPKLALEIPVNPSPVPSPKSPKYPKSFPFCGLQKNYP